MLMAAVDKKELWVGWTHDAMSRYVMPEEVEDSDELVDDMAEVATTYADQMLDEYENRFGGSAGRQRKRKPAKDDDDDDDD
jgi:predicted site-specific integrase-resolvase